MPVSTPRRLRGNAKGTLLTPSASRKGVGRGRRVLLRRDFFEQARTHGRRADWSRSPVEGHAQPCFRLSQGRAPARVRASAFTFYRTFSRSARRCKPLERTSEGAPAPFTSHEGSVARRRALAGSETHAEEAGAFLPPPLSGRGDRTLGSRARIRRQKWQGRPARVVCWRRRTRFRRRHAGESANAGGRCRSREHGEPPSRSSPEGNDWFGERLPISRNRAPSDVPREAHRRPDRRLPRRLRFRAATRHADDRRDPDSVPESCLQPLPRSGRVENAESGASRKLGPTGSAITTASTRCRTTRSSTRS